MSWSATEVGVESEDALVHAPDSPLAEVLRLGLPAARTDVPVLLSGERGTGKALIARYLHCVSPRAARPFVMVDCSAFDEAALERELFGLARGPEGVEPSQGGSQEGVQDGVQPGRLAEAGGGTLLLREADALPLALQRRLVRLLQERRYEPAGGGSSLPANVRLILATRRDLHAEVTLGRFRRELHHRMLSCPIAVPPLRERAADVPLLFMHHWKACGQQRPVEPALLAALARHTWPGNVRELAALTEHLAHTVDGPTLRLADLPPALQLADTAPGAQPARLSPSPGPTDGDAGAAPRVTPGSRLEMLLRLTGGELLSLPVDLPGLMRELEEAFVDAALARAGGNRRAAAELLGLQRTTLVEKLRRRRGREEAPSDA